jgi:hypothetical protein
LDFEHLRVRSMTFPSSAHLGPQPGSATPIRTRPESTRAVI